MKSEEVCNKMVSEGNLKNKKYVIETIGYISENILIAHKEMLYINKFKTSRKGAM